MPADIRELHFDFPATTGRPQFENQTVGFGSPVMTHSAALKGFDIHFENGDHHILRETISLSTSVNPSQPNDVRVDIEFLLRDDSGNIDDPYSGFVDVLVVANVA